MKTAVYFDFNGTLFLDHDINEMAWRETIKEIAGDQIDFDEFYKTAKAYMNYQIVTQAYNLINKPLVEEEIQHYAFKKEEIYQGFCRKLKRNQLVPGAEDVLNYLQAHNIPVILCTSSINYNVDFYFENVNLSRWFKREETVNDTGDYSSKLEMYLECARRLNKDIKDGVIFEDSPKSIKEAIETGCPNLVAMKRKDTPTHPVIKQIIEDFTKLDYSIFD